MTREVNRLSQASDIRPTIPTSEFKKYLSKPEVIDQVPLEKTQTIPTCSMNIPNSTIKGNIETIAKLLKQSGIRSLEDITDEIIEELIEYILLFHSDLGTEEKITAAQLHHSIEDSSMKRYQFVIFVLGLFHLKMACTDAIWCIFIKPPEARTDPSSVIAHINILRPWEIEKFISNLGFLEKVSNGKYKTLEEFAASKPTLEELQTLADHIAMTYDLHTQLKDDHDKQYENSLLIHQYYLLYEELSYAMNVGDIGRVECLFAPWAFIFRAVGKYKGSKAVRYSMLINLKGFEDTFRAINWVVELNNLYTKTINVAAGPNKTVDNIIKESNLINIFRDMYMTLEKNLILNYLTTLHGESDMKITYKVLLKHIEKENLHNRKKGRSSDYMIKDMINKGQNIYIATLGSGGVDVAIENDREEGDRETALSEEDISIDLLF
ncbi:hypothetical protein C8Q75DRAFT_805592 [Abortiporus biennis]|nr:hypothetical protein C8Q75DRAFT_805592 [Abortiporus biennis]